MHRSRVVVGLGVLAAALTGMPLRAQAPRWVVTHRWVGFGSQQTEMFWVNGSAWRVRYRPAGRGLFQVAVYDAQGRLVDMVANQTDDRLFAGARKLEGRGKRYLGITGLDTTWEVTVEQLVSVVEEWYLRQLLQQPPPRLLKLGVWTGTDGESEYTFSVPSPSWQIRHSHGGDGLLQIIVTDSEGFVALGANEVRATEGVCWVHKPGTFTMRVKADGVQWKVEVFCEDAGGGEE